MKSFGLSQKYALENDLKIEKEEKKSFSRGNRISQVRLESDCYNGVCVCACVC